MRDLAWLGRTFFTLVLPSCPPDRVILRPHARCEFRSGRQLPDRRTHPPHLISLLPYTATHSSNITVAISLYFPISFPTSSASCERKAQPRRSFLGPVMSENQVTFVRNVRIPAEAIATTTLATLAVLLRFFSRWMKGLRYKRDDWMLAASMVSKGPATQGVESLLTRPRFFYSRCCSSS